MSWVHLHLLLNHVPVMGTFIGLLLLLVAFVRKSEELKKVTLAFFVLIALVTIPVYFTGEPAEELIENIPGISEAVIERHEDAAIFSLIAVEVVGLVALVGLLLFRRKKSVANLLATATLAFSLVAGGLMGWTANLGGQIRHTEINSGIASPSQTEKANTGSQTGSAKEERDEH